jgi:hypothetical protein
MASFDPSWVQGHDMTPGAPCSLGLPVSDCKSAGGVGLGRLQINFSKLEICTKCANTEA